MKKWLFPIGVMFILLAMALGVLFFVLPVRGSIPVLMYHFIDTPERAAREKNVVSLQSFRNQMAFLSRFGFRPIDLDEFAAILEGRQEPQGREVVITFDDGNYTFGDQAFPVLRDHGFPSALFVVSENMKAKAHGSMGTDEIRQLAQSGLVTIGCHTRTHALLPQLSEEERWKEIAGSRQELETLLGFPIVDFAYPAGLLNAAVVEDVRKAGYRLAFTTSGKKLQGLPETPWTVTRIKISRTSDHPVAFWFKLSGLYSGFKTLRREGPGIWMEAGKSGALAWTSKSLYLIAVQRFILILTD